MKKGVDTLRNDFFRFRVQGIAFWKSDRKAVFEKLRKRRPVPPRPFRLLPLRKAPQNKPPMSEIQTKGKKTYSEHARQCQFFSFFHNKDLIFPRIAYNRRCMETTFYEFLERTARERYPGYAFNIDTQFSRKETALLFNMDAALSLLATEVYGLRSEFSTYHERNGIHCIVISSGHYNRNEFVPRIEAFFADCLKMRNEENLVLDARKNRSGNYILEFDEPGDIFDLLCLLCERPAFSSAFGPKGKSTVSIETFSKMFDSLSDEFFLLYEHEKPDLTAYNPTPRVNFH